MEDTVDSGIMNITIGGSSMLFDLEELIPARPKISSKGHSSHIGESGVG